ncbi:MAG TPA: tripartite tricarboxylate transporter substrate binding protein [Thermodesulfobacteriota bacterium]|nr:tripartite tricarboxylate transporter substrate binding protein [Thermodesulfobacteriota bacterium]
MKRSCLPLALLLIVCGLRLGVTHTLAQPFPNRPIQLIIPLPPGAQGDISARILTEEMARILGTQIIPVNKPGAALTLGTDAVVRSKKDGYTIGYTSSGAIVYARVINPETVPYDPGKDLEPLGVHLFYPLTVTVQESSPWKTLPELVGYAKKNPGKLRVSTTGVGSTDHFNVGIIQSVTGAQFTHVPFKGGESVVTALLGGHVEVTFDTLSKVLPHVESGKLRVLVISKKRAEFPNIPTLTELGYKQGMISAWFGFYAPTGIPEEARKALVSAIEKAINNPELKAKTEKLGFIVDYKPPAESRRLAAEDYERALSIAEKLGLR